MSDARNSLQAAIEAKKAGGGAEKLKPPPKAPVKSSPPPTAPRRSSAPSKSSAPPPKAEKPKSSFLKKKKKKSPKQKTKVSENKDGGEGGLGAGFGKLAKNLIGELKEATSEISPANLLATAKDGLSTLGETAKTGMSNIRTGGEESDPASRPDATKNKANGDAIALAMEARDLGTQDAKDTSAPEERKDFSSITVQKAPPDRRKAKNGPPTAEPVASKEPVLDPDDTARDAEPEAEDETPADISATETEADATNSPSHPSKVAAPAEVSSATQAKRATNKKSQESEPVDALEDEKPVGIVDEETPEPSEDDAATEEQEQASETTETKEERKETKTKRAKKVETEPVEVSKEEQLVRLFYSLQQILNNRTWNPIVTTQDSNPSSVFTPRQLFDKQLSTPEFRAGLKASNILARRYTFDPSDVEFDHQVIQAIKNYQLDPQNMIKPKTELITEAIGADKTEEVLKLINKGKVKKLLYSVGTRLSTIVPTIEILTRIYIGLRKKQDIIPGDRLQIQEDISVKYIKTPYTEKMAKQARNLSLDYFTDYLTEYGYKLYEDRMQQAIVQQALRAQQSPEAGQGSGTEAAESDGQNHLSETRRRHETIIKSSRNIVREWGTRVGISSQAMMNLESRLTEMADKYIADTTGATPDEE